MKAKINSQVLDVKVINDNYNEHAKEVMILDGVWKGIYCIVENQDFIIDKPRTKNYRYYVQRSEQGWGILNKKTVTVKKCETLEEARGIKAKHDKSNHSNIYSFRILDRGECKYL